MGIDVSSESSARQWIRMKKSSLISSKDKSKTLKCRLLQFLFGALRLKFYLFIGIYCKIVQAHLKTLIPVYSISCSVIIHFNMKVAKMLSL